MSRIESFTRMFDKDAAHGDGIARIEIPLIQRDYAQGRRDGKVNAIRQSFLAVLHGAVAGEDPTPVSLDFVYGERKEDGTFQPLDGQQRLTTLFLLHWYLSARSGNLATATTWTNFSYETRPSARRFCQRLVAATPPADTSGLSKWIHEQPWYLFVWRYDPTIDSMLVMMDAIDQQFSGVDPQVAWDRLADVKQPAVSFHLLPLPDMGSAEDLYVKMNSRGKPLTEFENFKARFEKVIEWSPRAADFAHKADTVWSDILWTSRGDDDLIDDEFLRYFEFVTEVCEWSDDNLDSGAGVSTLLERAVQAFGADSPKRVEHLDFLFTAFDVWVGLDIKATFEVFFRAQGSPAEASLPLFFRDPSVNLFESCCRAYGEMTGGGNRNFTFGQTLLLLAVVRHLADDTSDFAARLRTLRNLVEGSPFEMRAERMPRLVADSRQLVLSGELPQPGSTFAVSQIGDEADKRTFLAEQPDAAEVLQDLEDNYLLRGSTTAFALDVDTLRAHAPTFNALMDNPELWWDLTGALLTVGEYQRPRERNGTLSDSEAFQFGTWNGKFSDAWREVFVGRSRADGSATSNVLGEFLATVAASSSLLGDTLKTMQAAWLQERENAGSFDWRYYLVKYRSAREGASGIYFAHGRRMGFSLTNLPGGRKYRNAYYHDPYLRSIFEAAGEPAEVAPLWFSGYEWDARWLRLTRSGTGLRSVPSGFQIARPAPDEFQSKFDEVAAELGVVATAGDEPELLINVAKTTDDAAGPDGEDRVRVGARVLKRFIEAAL